MGNLQTAGDRNGSLSAGTVIFMAIFRRATAAVRPARRIVLENNYYYHYRSIVYKMDFGYIIMRIIIARDETFSRGTRENRK